MSTYSTDPVWADVTPIPLDDGSNFYPVEGQDASGDTNGTMPLATISYSEEYTEAMSYLRAVMAANEMSDRALELTKDIIKMNPAHYTVWYVHLYKWSKCFCYQKSLLTSVVNVLGSTGRRYWLL